jgi:calcineurin-like phosphoesterase family protein
MTIWFTSDTHLSHRNIIQYCNRPDQTVLDMDKRIINNWNKVVRKDDIIYHLGDFSFCNKKNEVEELLRQLNGQKHLIVGNHDRDETQKAKGWGTVSPLKMIKIKYKDKKGIDRYQDITLCHYAMKVWKNSGRGSWQLYGHSHGTLPDDPNSFQMDVGVDSNNFTPISFQQVKYFMEKKYYLPKDYHGHAGVSTIPEHLEQISHSSYFNEDLQYKWDSYFQEKF